MIRIGGKDLGQTTRNMVGMSARDLLTATWTPMIREPFKEHLKQRERIAADFVKQEIAELYGEIYKKQLSSFKQGGQ